MTQSLARMQTNLAAVLLADTALAAWFVDQLGKAPLVIKGNVPIAKLNPTTEIPGLIFEVDKGTNELQVPRHVQSPNVELPFSLVWVELDRELAYDQRVAVVDLMIDAVIRNPTLDIGDGNGDAVGGAWIKSFETNLGANHPMQIMGFVAEAFYQREV